jgi:hypothetical protein
MKRMTLLLVPALAGVLATPPASAEPARVNRSASAKYQAPPARYVSGGAGRLDTFRYLWCPYEDVQTGNTVNARDRSLGWVYCGEHFSHPRLESQSPR